MPIDVLKFSLYGGIWQFVNTGGTIRRAHRMRCAGGIPLAFLRWAVPHGADNIPCRSVHTQNAHGGTQNHHDVHGSGTPRRRGHIGFVPASPPRCVRHCAPKRESAHGISCSYLRYRAWPPVLKAKRHDPALRVPRARADARRSDGYRKTANGIRNSNSYCKITNYCGNIRNFAAKTDTIS